MLGTSITILFGVILRQLNLSDVIDGISVVSSLSFNMTVNFIDTFERIRKSPPMFLGIQSVVRLHTFINGFLFAAVQANEENRDYVMKFRQFNQWLAQKYAIKAMLGWSDILLQVSNNNDEAALELFWKEWDEFCKLQDLEVLR